ncbi:C40 family peptidase [Kitasatospora sp. NBC_01302]|uniref:C40 family peptidase n=1 Tax=Kitasatospora sp. NBC_01302 TaxID=2903575 RepID=UPI002E161CCD|nr:C40 family peptidase [Kitasatospora sp. NBC_01302]
MNTRHRAWPRLAALASLPVLGLLLLCAIATHAANLAQASQNQAAQQPACPGAGAAVDIARLDQAVTAVLAGAGAAAPTAVPGLEAPGEQIPNARAIVATGAQMGVPARGQVIALAVALQESGLRNLTGGDRDSLGLFQQRPSQGWGTREQILDPVYASQKFYGALLAVPGWQQLPLTVAAQRVQQSAYPDAYASHEALATALQQAIAPTLPAAQGAPATPGAAGPSAPAAGLPGLGEAAAGSAGAGACGGAGAPADPSAAAAAGLPAGYQIPVGAPAVVRTAIGWALGQLGTAYQWGGECTNPHGSDPAGRCDCSSLVQRAYGVAGITLARTTYDQVGQGVAVPTDPGAIAPGDLLFTEGSPQAPGHVGMAIGQGLVVQAPHTGAVVDVLPISGFGQLLAVRRVVNT